MPNDPGTVLMLGAAAMAAAMLIICLIEYTEYRSERNGKEK